VALLKGKFTQWVDEPTKISRRLCRQWHGFSDRKIDAAFEDLKTRADSTVRR